MLCGFLPPTTVRRRRCRLTFCWSKKRLGKRKKGNAKRRRKELLSESIVDEWMQFLVLRARNDERKAKKDRKQNRKKKKGNTKAGLVGIRRRSRAKMRRAPDRAKAVPCRSQLEGARISIAITKEKQMQLNERRNTKLKRKRDHGKTNKRQEPPRVSGTSNRTKGNILKRGSSGCKMNRKDKSSNCKRKQRDAYPHHKHIRGVPYYRSYDTRAATVVHLRRDMLVLT
ncbi:hypothetical protein HDK77DRAFT_302237 [Phyllosticta capitalensis]|uniref:uncharacterized protein n=1 Tax=Phyllosticta capitalensis TaxID=121624 RepID=UPI00312D328E